MVLTLLVTMIVLGVGMTVMWVSSSGMKTSSSITRRQEALYAAESGVARVRSIIAAFDGNYETLLRGCDTAENDPTRGNVLCDPVTNVKLQDVRVVTGQSLGQTRPAPQNGRYTVWIRNDWMAECGSMELSADKVDCDKDGAPDRDQAMFQDDNRRVILRAEGTGRDGLSFVALEVVLVGPPMNSGASSYNQLGFNAQGTHSGGDNTRPTRVE